MNFKIEYDKERAEFSVHIEAWNTFSGKQYWKEIAYFRTTTNDGYISLTTGSKEYKHFNAWKKTVETKVNAGKPIDWDSYI